ncbi:MAG: iron-sulfur cluster assembly scaffold protein, partial [Oscillospiraceae bacterium]|nr:iron-sulfur cluster assembly scaffold protein [Oscillospiraceae bacterium]
MRLKLKDKIITEASFKGNGCAVSKASTDILLDKIL